MKFPIHSLTEFPIHVFVVPVKVKGGVIQHLHDPLGMDYVVVVVDPVVEKQPVGVLGIEKRQPFHPYGFAGG